MLRRNCSRVANVNTPIKSTVTYAMLFPCSIMRRTTSARKLGEGIENASRRSRKILPFQPFSPHLKKQFFGNFFASGGQEPRVGGSNSTSTNVITFLIWSYDSSRFISFFDCIYNFSIYIEKIEMVLYVNKSIYIWRLSRKILMCSVKKMIKIIRP